MTLSSWAPAVLIGILSTAALPLVAGHSIDPRVSAGVFPPWWRAADVLAAAGEAGSFVRLGAFPFIVVVRSEDGDAAARLSASGALFNLDPLGLTGCFAGQYQ